MNLRYSRIIKELASFKKDPVPGIDLTAAGDGMLTHLSAAISGPAGTPYEGGTFQIDVQIPREFPFLPPKLKFVTKVWHPNVNSQSGETCLAYMGDLWTPVFSLQKLLLVLQAMLSEPEPRFPLDPVATHQFLNDHPAFLAKACHWTKAFARRSRL